MRVFIAGIMQGSRRDEALEDQSYRARITAALSAHAPAVEVVDPLALHPGSVAYSAEQGRSAFLELAGLAGRCDVVVAYVPEASMGTAIEMWEAARAGARVFTISPLAANWVVAFLSERVFASLDEFLAFVEQGGLAADAPAAANAPAPSAGS